MRAKQRIRPSAHPDLCLATIPPGGRSGGWDDPAMKHANPYAGLVGSPAPAEPEDPSDAVEERGLRDETGSGALAEAAEMSRPSPPRPRCGASPARRDGRGPSGCGGGGARRALRRPHQGGARGPRRGRARRSSTTARGPIASPSGRTALRTSPARRTRGTRGTWRRWS